MASAPHIPPLQSLEEAAEYLGVHYTTILRWRDQGKITLVRPTLRGSSRLYLRGSDLQRFLDSMPAAGPDPTL